MVGTAKSAWNGTIICDFFMFAKLAIVIFMVAIVPNPVRNANVNLPENSAITNYLRYNYVPDIVRSYVDFTVSPADMVCAVKRARSNKVPPGAAA